MGHHRVSDSPDALLTQVSVRAHAHARTHTCMQRNTMQRNARNGFEIVVAVALAVVPLGLVSEK